MFAPARAEITDVDSRATRDMTLPKAEPLEKRIRRRVNQSTAVQADIISVSNRIGRYQISGKY